MSFDEEGHKWRESVETRLVSLTSAQKQTDDDLDKYEARLDAMDDLLEGKPEDKDDSGLKGDLQDLARGLKKLEVIMAPDSLQHGGVIKRLEALESLAGIKLKASENRWKFGTVVAAATVTAIAGIITALLALDPVRKSVGVWVASYIEAPKKPAKKPPKKPPKRMTLPPPSLEGITDGPQAGSQ